MTAQASRYPSDALTSQSKPVCFPPAPAQMGLAERARYDDLVDVCSQAARKEDVVIAEPGSPSCLVANLRFGSEYSGRSEVQCGYGWYDCTAHDTFDKWLNIDLVDSASGETMVETRTGLNSDFKDFSKSTTFVLCSAAFREFPRAMRSESIEVELPEE